MIKRGKDKELGAPQARTRASNQNGRDELNLSTDWIAEKDPHVAVTNWARRLIQLYMSLYTNMDLLTTWAGGISTSIGNGGLMPRMTFNLVKIYGDTLAGRLVQNFSRLVPVTMGGDFKLWQQAKKLEKALEGETYRMHLYREMERVALDAINTGTGFLKILKTDNGEYVKCERVFPNEIFVDINATRFSEPVVMAQIRYMTKADAQALWGTTKAMREMIDGASIAPPPAFQWTAYSPAMIEVFEAWALPLGDRPGRHVLCLSSGTIVDEGCEEFPFVVFKAGIRPDSWYGQGFIEQFGPAQIELNKILDIMSQSAEISTVPRWLVQNGTAVDQENLINMSGVLVTHDGPAPTLQQLPPFAVQTLQYSQSLAQMIAEGYGINGIEAGRTDQTRYDSRKALVQLQDMTTMRHMGLLHRWGEAFEEVGRRIISIACDIAKDKGKYPVMAANKKTAWSLDWKELCDMKHDCYRLRIAEANLLPNTPAGKINAIEDLAKVGILTPKHAAMLLAGPPDIDAVVAEVTASEQYIDKMISDMLDGKQRYPTPLIDLSRALQRVGDARLEAENFNAPPRVLRIMENFLSSATELVKQLTVPQQADPLGAPGVINVAGSPSDAQLGALPGNFPGTAPPGGQPTPGTAAAAGPTAPSGPGPATGPGGLSSPPSRPGPAT
jgi:hypothetical protein